MFPSCQLIKFLSSLSVFSNDLEVPFMAFECSLDFSIKCWDLTLMSFLEMTVVIHPLCENGIRRSIVFR